MTMPIRMIGGPRDGQEWTGDWPEVLQFNHQIADRADGMALYERIAYKLDYDQHDEPVYVFMGPPPPGVYVGGELVFPANDPDQAEAEMAAELALEKARDAVIDAARAVAAARLQVDLPAQYHLLDTIEAAVEALGEAEAKYQDEVGR